ncbi:MAG: glycoside-pentoside-hexuronide (GPH):cation symporter [Alkalispirochaeta sp.]
MDSNTARHIPLSERAAFGMGVLGQNVIYGISVGFMMFAFTDLLAIAPAAAGMIFLITRSWDAINDPVMGFLADRTRTRWGRFRPWLLWTPLPIGILTILGFVNPGLSPSATIVYGTAIYVLWGMVYTLNDIPMWALTSAMTPNTVERTRVITIGRALAMIGLGVPTVALPALAGLFSGTHAPSAGYLPAAAVLSAGAVPLMLFAFLGTRERVPVSGAPARVSELGRMLRANRPLQIIVLAGLLNSFTFVAQSMVVYFVTHNLGDPNLMIWFGGTGIAALAGGVAITPLFSERFGKRATMIVTSLARTVAGVLLYMVGYSDLSIAVTLYAIMVGLVGPTVVLQTAMIADAVEYGERTTGVRAEGVTFSFQTFLSKANAALGGMVGGVLLARVGYEAGMSQTVDTLWGIYAILTLTPAVAGAMSAIPFFWYPLKR